MRGIGIAKARFGMLWFPNLAFLLRRRARDKRRLCCLAGRFLKEVLEERLDNGAGVVRPVLIIDQIVFGAVQRVPERDGPDTVGGEHPVHLESGVEPVVVFHTHIPKF